jgi:hypothetical protein
VEVAAAASSSTRKTVWQSEQLMCSHMFCMLGMVAHAAAPGGVAGKQACENSAFGLVSRSRRYVAQVERMLPPSRGGC